MPSYKLTYFHARDRAETSRLILSQAGAEFDDCRLEMDEWRKLKPKTPQGQIPILETDGHTLAESTAISRLLAKRYGLAGADEYEAANCDMLVCAADEARLKFYPWVFEKDPEKKKDVYEQILKDHTLPFAQQMENILAENKSGFFVGKNLTWADLHLFNFFDVFSMSEEQMKGFARLSAFMKKVAELPKIKAWLANRPKTPK